MLEFLPGWVKALMGTGLILFIGIAGFALTSKKANKGSKSSSGDGGSKN